MRVLLISHTVLSRTNNMGKTLLGYLADFHPGEVAQLYIHSEVPTDAAVSTDYYRFTDVDAAKSVLNPFHKGRVFTAQDVQTDRVFARTDEGMLNSAYVLGGKRKAWTMNARELVWKASHWKRPELKEWISSFDPEVILFASGDYAFMYDIAYWVAEYCKKPLVTICVDDYYLCNRNGDSLSGRLHQAAFMKSVRRTIRRSCFLFTLSDLMKDAYEDLFGIPCYTVHNSVPYREVKLADERHAICYLGNLGFGRAAQLAAIGNALAALKRTEEPTAIDVYTGSNTQEYLNLLRSAEGVRLHGKIGPEEVRAVMTSSLAVIHTESFDEKMQELVRFSVSTKIAESLMYGPCLLAYGPAEIASIDYLKKNHAAYCVTRPEDLESGLRELLADPSLREEIEKNARALAAENHDADVYPKKVRAWLQEAIDRPETAL